MAWSRSPPFAPWPCRCTRTMVASTMAYSMSGSPLTASNRRTKTSAFTQSRKRLNTVFHLPKCSGKSRHGLPVRTIHKTASTNNRLSVPLRPRSPTLPKQMGSYEPIVDLSKRIESHQDFAWAAEQTLKSPQTLASSATFFYAAAMLRLTDSLGLRCLQRAGVRPCSRRRVARTHPGERLSPRLEPCPLLGR